MNVAELIERLSALPPHIQVVTSGASGDRAIDSVILDKTTHVGASTHSITVSCARIVTRERT